VIEVADDIEKGEAVNEITVETIAEQVRKGVLLLQKMGRNDLVLRSIGGVNAIEQMLIDAARTKLSRLVITRDFRFLLTDYNKEVEMTAIHKAVYLLFLNHPEGLEFKELIDHKEELKLLYAKLMPTYTTAKVEEVVAKLVDPLDNSINEKCSRIRKAFADLVDQYSLSYYMISSHTTKKFNSSNRIWYQRLKIITLPRELVTIE